jgi:hypothetical protein
MKKDKSNYLGRQAIIKYSHEQVTIFKETIKQEFDSFSDLTKAKNDINIPNYNNYINNEEITKIYFYEYTQYILHKFNSSIVNMIIIFVNENKSFPQEYKNENEFISNIVNLLKHLLMNEIEVAYFTVLIDKIGWKYEKLEHWVYFAILGIISKKSCAKKNDNYYKLLINIFNKKYPEFIDKYSSFVFDENIQKIINDSNINIHLINQRFNELTRPINTYCRKNYIMMGGIIDKIVNLSHPYFKFEDPNDPNKTKNKNKNNKNKFIQLEDLLFNLNKQEEAINFDKIKSFGSDIMNSVNFDENYDFSSFYGSYEDIYN